MLALFALTALATEPPAPPSPVAAQMHAPFALITQARAALEKGDLTQARGHAQALVDLAPPEGLTDPWRPYMAELKSDAASLAAATSPDAAARQVAAIAITCAACHQAKGGGPAIPAADTLDVSTDASKRDVGTDLLWLSLITGSADAWKRGTALLEQPDAPAWGLIAADDDAARADAFATLLTP